MTWARVLALAAALLLAGIVWFAWRNSSDEAPAEMLADRPPQPPQAAEPPAVSAAPVQPTGRSVPAGPSGQPLAVVEVWQEVAVDDYPEELPVLREDISGARLVTLKRRELRALTTGQRFDAFVPQLGTGFEVEVRSSRRKATGSQTIAGQLQGESMFGAVITVGGHGTFGTITTPEGAFTLRGEGDFAWIIDNRELRQHIDYSQPDYR